MSHDLYSFNDDNGRSISKTLGHINQSLMTMVLTMTDTFRRPDGSRLLERLTTVILVNSRANEIYNTRAGLPPAFWSNRLSSHLLCLPTLKTFIASDLLGIYENMNLAKGSVNITTLSLLRYGLEIDIVRQILHACKAFESFHWTSFCSQQISNGSTTSNSSPAFLNFAQTLKFTALHRECQCHYPLPT